MKLTKDMLDKKIKEFEPVEHDMTFREYVVEEENELGIANADLDSMTDEQLSEYDSWLMELCYK